LCAEYGHYKGSLKKAKVPMWVLVHPGHGGRRVYKIGTQGGFHHGYTGVDELCFIHNWVPGAFQWMVH